jgi:hypothetical protein
MGFYYPQRDRNHIRMRAEGLIAETFPRGAAAGQTTPTSGDVRATLIGLRAGDVVTNLHVIVAVVAATVTTAKLGLYSSADVLLASTANDTAIVTNLGTRTKAVSAPYTVTEDGGYYVAALVVATTMPQFVRGVSAVGVDTALTGGERICWVDAGETDLPATATPAASTSAVWFGIS